MGEIRKHNSSLTIYLLQRKINKLTNFSCDFRNDKLNSFFGLYTEKLEIKSAPKFIAQNIGESYRNLKVLKWSIETFN